MRNNCAVFVVCGVFYFSNATIPNVMMNIDYIRYKQEANVCAVDSSVMVNTSRLA